MFRPHHVIAIGLFFFLCSGLVFGKPRKPGDDLRPATNVIKVSGGGGTTSKEVNIVKIVKEALNKWVNNEGASNNSSKSTNIGKDVDSKKSATNVIKVSGGGGTTSKEVNVVVKIVKEALNKLVKDDTTSKGVPVGNTSNSKKSTTESKNGDTGLPTQSGGRTRIIPTRGQVVTESKNGDTGLPTQSGGRTRIIPTRGQVVTESKNGDTGLPTQSGGRTRNTGNGGNTNVDPIVPANTGGGVQNTGNGGNTNNQVIEGSALVNLTRVLNSQGNNQIGTSEEQRKSDYNNDGHIDLVDFEILRKSSL